MKKAFHQAVITLNFANPYTEEQLWHCLDRLNRRYPAVRVHKAGAWFEEPEDDSEVDAGPYEAADIAVMDEAVEGEDMFDAGRKLTDEVLWHFKVDTVESVELTSLILGDPDNIAYVGGVL